MDTVSSALLDPDTDPWAMLPGEPPKAFEAFRKYRDLPPAKRNVNALLTRFIFLRDSDDYAPPATRRETLDSWKLIYRWDERASAWDSELDRIWRDEQSAVVREAARRQLRESQVLQEIGMAALDSVSPVDLSTDPKEARLYITEGAEMERGLLGIDKKKDTPNMQVVNPVLVIQMADMMERRLREGEDISLIRDDVDVIDGEIISEE